MNPEPKSFAKLAQREEILRSQFILAQAGDTSAYSALLVALAGHLRSYYRRKLMRIPDEIEDLVQETLIAIHNQRHSYDNAYPFTAWVFAIARYKLIDRYRQFARHDAHFESFDDEAEPSHGAEDNAHEAKRDIGLLLETLPEKQKMAIQWVKIEGLSISEASLKTGLSESAVKVSIHRGLKALAAKVRGANP